MRAWQLAGSHSSIKVFLMDARQTHCADQLLLSATAKDSGHSSSNPPPQHVQDLPQCAQPKFHVSTPPPRALRTAVNDTLCQHLEEVLVIKYHAVTDPGEALNKTASKRQRLGRWQTWQGVGCGGMVVRLGGGY
jgi:hypothetical protein